MEKPWRWASGIFVFACEILPSSAQGQVAPVAPAPAHKEAVSQVQPEGGEILVTASRRSQRLMGVPMAITAVSEQELKASGAVTTRDLGQLAAGLTSTTNGKSFQPAIRGVSSTGTSAGDEQNVALYIDDVYMAASSGNAFNLKNIERIEVLKGPQGTLFGRNATGGAIRIITKDPGQDTTLEGSLSYGTRLKSKDLSVYAATPISGNLAIGISGDIYKDEGYQTNIAPGWTGGKLSQTRSWIVRAKSVWTPTADLSMTLAGDVGFYKSDVPFALAPVNGLNQFRNTAGAILPTKDYELAYNLRPNETNHTKGISLQARYTLPTFTLQSTTAYRTNSLYAVLDNDRTNLASSVAVSGDSLKWFTQEGLLTSNLGGPVEFIAGIYYFNSRGTTLADAYTNGPVTASDGSIISLGTPGALTRGYVDTESVAGFGEATYRVAGPLKLIGGLRYTTETKSLLTTPIRPVAPNLTDKHTWRNWSFRVTGQYDLAGGNVYATYSTGFKSGVYNASSASFVQRVEPETINAIEVGIKSRVFDIFDVRLAAFHYKYTDIQVQTTNFIAGRSQIVLANAAAARMTGAEGEVTARIRNNLRLKVGLSWLPKATYKSFPNGLDSVPKGFPGALDPSLCPGISCGLGNDQIVRDLSGTRVIRSPKFTSNIGMSYDHELFGGELGLTANYFFTSKFNWQAGDHIVQPSYSVVNATIAWTAPGERYRLSVFGRNLNNAYYGVYTSATAVGISTAPAAPREIGLTLDFKI